MSIRPNMRWRYPIDWPQLSQLIRFGRAKGRCEICARPHGNNVLCLSGGRWFDAGTTQWRDGRGAACAAPWGADLEALRGTRVVLAVAHLDHDPGNNDMSNLKCLCQRCHVIHDKPHHLAQRRLTYRMRWAVGDLFTGLYVRR